MSLQAPEGGQSELILLCHERYSSPQTSWPYLGWSPQTLYSPKKFDRPRIRRKPLPRSGLVFTAKGVLGQQGHLFVEGGTDTIEKWRIDQWRLYWANSKNGIMDPPQVGGFKNGRGEFFAQDTINGRTILIRYAWTDMTTNSPHFEQSFSDDGGKTWEVNFITDQTRVKDESDKAH